MAEIACREGGTATTGRKIRLHAHLFLIGGDINYDNCLPDDKWFVRESIYRILATTIFVIKANEYHRPREDLFARLPLDFNTSLVSIIDLPNSRRYLSTTLV